VTKKRFENGMQKVLQGRVTGENIIVSDCLSKMLLISISHAPNPTHLNALVPTIFVLQVLVRYTDL